MKRILTASLIILALTNPLIFGNSDSPIIIAGIVSSLDRTPIMGATVTVISSDKILSQAASDTRGRFAFKLTGLAPDSLVIGVTAIGFESRSVAFAVKGDTIRVDISLEDKPVDLGTIRVTPQWPLPALDQNYTASHIDDAARHSLLTTNPINAIRQPQVVREGSSNSAKIRINGTNPVYYIDGMEIGYDPNHYGMFSIFPGSIVDNIKFSPQGADATYGSPSVIDLETSRAFTDGISSQIDLSFIEGTGSAIAGNDRYFVLASLRKSVLDKIADKITAETNRMTIPPTDFRDLFVSTGLKLTARTCLLVDHYQVADYLSYNLGATSINPKGVNTMQDTGEEFLGLRLETLTDHLFCKINGAVKESRETYYAHSLDDQNPPAFLVDLSAVSRIGRGGANVDLLLGKTEITLGGNFQYCSGRQIRYQQVNWNFLPPDAGSDNPFIYQSQLNEMNAEGSIYGDEFSAAGYLSLKQSLGKFRLVSGLRQEYFGGLSASHALLHRNSLSLNSGLGIISLSYGTYARNPAGRILEPYQVLIYENLKELRPVVTNLAALSFAKGSLKVEFFDKRIVNIPVLAPDFSAVDSDGNPVDGFINVASAGKIRFLGGDIALAKDGLYSGRLDLYISYGYTHAIKSHGDIRAPYELNAPHKFALQAGYDISRHFTLGGSLAVRSGNPYTPPSDDYQLSYPDKYTPEYYRGILRRENAAKFPINFTSNIFFDLNLSHSQLYLTLCNVSNYHNPIISTQDGFVYDTGLLPSLGYRYRF